MSYASGLVKNRLPRKSTKILWAAVYVLVALSLVFPLVLFVENNAYAVKKTEEPNFLGAAVPCAPPWRISHAKQPSKDDFMALKSFETKTTADGVIGTNNHQTWYIGEYTKPINDPFSWEKNKDDSRPSPNYEDGSPRVAWGSDEGDWRISPNGTYDQWGRCWGGVGPSIATSILNFGLWFLNTGWILSNWVFENVLDAGFVKAFLKGMSDIISGTSGGNGGLRQALFLDFLPIVIVVVGIWGIFKVVRLQALSLIAGIVWALGISLLGSVLLINPMGLTTVVEDATAGLQSTVISSIMSGSSGAGMCKTNQVGKAGYKSVDDLTQMTSCASWQSLVFEPSTIAQWGVSSNKLNQLAGKKAPTVQVGSNSISNWAFYNMYSQVQVPDAQGRYSFEQYRDADRRFARVVDAVASEKGEHDLFGEWSKTNGSSLLGSLTLLLLFAVGGLWLAKAIVVSGIEIVVYSLLAAGYLLIAPFAFVLGVHPTFGKRILARWAGGWFGTFLHRIGASAALAIMLMLVTFVFSYSWNNNPIKTALFLIVILTVFTSLKKQVHSMVGAILPGASEENPMQDLKQNALKTARVGVAAGTVGYGLHKAASATRGKFFSNLAGKAKAINNGDKAWTGTKGGKVVKEEMDRNFATGDNSEALDSIMKKEAKGNYGVKREKGESENDFLKRKRKAKEEREKQLESYRGKSQAELESGNYGLRAKDFRTKEDFAKAVDEKRKDYQDVMKKNVAVNGKAQYRDYLRSNGATLGQLSKGGVASAVQIATMPTRGTGLRGLYMTARTGSNAAQASSVKSGNAWVQKQRDRANNKYAKEEELYTQKLEQAAREEQIERSWDNSHNQPKQKQQQQRPQKTDPNAPKLILPPGISIEEPEQKNPELKTPTDPPKRKKNKPDIPVPKRPKPPSWQREKTSEALEWEKRRKLADEMFDGMFGGNEQ